MRRTANLFLFLAGAAMVVGGLPARGSAAASFHLVAPAPESFVDKEKVLLIVKVKDHDPKLTQVELLDNGKSAGFLPVKHGVVATLLTLAPGSHDLALAAPGIKRLGLKVFRGKQAGYKFHAELDLAECVGCHPDSGKGGGWGLPKGKTESVLCAACHELKEKGPFVHGPVAAGVCYPCHDPHGSAHPHFLVATGRDLCLTCHNQGLSAGHIGERKNADCTSCHDPHSSAKKFHLREKK